MVLFDQTELILPLWDKLLNLPFDGCSDKKNMTHCKTGKEYSPGKVWYRGKEKIHSEIELIIY